MPQAPMVGRDAERAAIEAWLDGVRPAVLLVDGAAGGRTVPTTLVSP